MSISNINTTGFGYGTGSATRTLGTAIAGDKRVAVVVAKPDTATISLNQGFTLVASKASTSGVAPGIDVGRTQVQIWEKDTDGSDNGLTLTATLTSGSVIGLNTFVIRKTDATKNWDVQAATGEDLTDGTAWSSALSPNVEIYAESYFMVYSAVPTDIGAGAHFNSESLSASGITFSAGAALGEADSSSGQDIGGHGWRGAVATGTGNKAVTYTATCVASTNMYGPTAMVVFSEVAPPPSTLTYEWHAQGGSNTPVTDLQWHTQGGSNVPVVDSDWHTQV